MALFRRKQETLNEQLLREAGLDDASQALRDPPPVSEHSADPGPFPVGNADLGGQSSRRPRRERRNDGHAPGGGLARRSNRVHDVAGRRHHRRRGEGWRRPCTVRRGRRATRRSTVPRDRRPPGRRSLGGPGEPDSGREVRVRRGRRDRAQRERRRPRKFRSTTSRARRRCPSSSSSASGKVGTTASRRSESTATLGGQSPAPLGRYA